MAAAIDKKAGQGEHTVVADLIAVLVAVTAGQPRVMTVHNGCGLPAGPFAHDDRSLQSGLRSWVERQTGRSLGYVEQLYTFADRDRATNGARVISISYLGLTREGPDDGAPGWRDWYTYFPWEDHRAGRPCCLDDLLVSRLRVWTKAAPERTQRRERLRRVAITFGLDHRTWNEDLILQRYELLYEAGLVAEAPHRGTAGEASPLPGQSMLFDHRRILATGIARLRAKIKYRPVVFELMPPSFTLLQLQRTVEALAGRPVHKQNFRRLIAQQDLVEEIGAMAERTGGRPAKLFQFRRDVVDERSVVGTKLPLARA
ncbi:MAG TPA: hypothetical protein VGJ20_21795 [Xanthobacteraceae bacterium]